MSDAQPPVPFIDVEAGPGGGRITANSIEELVRVVGAERMAWNWLWQDPHKNVGHLNRYRDSINRAKSRIDGRIKEIKEALEQDPNVDLRNLIKSLEKEIQHSFSTEFIYSQSQLAFVVKDLVRREAWDVVEAIHDLRLGQQLRLNDINKFRGATLLVLSEQGLLSAVDADRAEGITRHHSLLKEKSAHLDEEISRLDELIEKGESDVRTGIDRALKSHASLVRKSRKGINDLRGEFKSQFEKDREHFRVELALEAPVEYWAKRRDINRGLAVLLYGVFLGAFFMFVSVAYHTYRQIGGSGVFPIGEGGVVVVAVLVLIVALVVALLRIPLRLASSFLHLANDADERVTMVNTYLALREGGHAESAQMTTVIERLFLPTQDGIVKDDLVGITVADVLSKMRP